MRGNIRFMLALFIMFSAVNLEGIVDLPTELTIAFVGIAIGIWGLILWRETNEWFAFD